MIKNTDKKQINPLDLSARFLAARPDLVGAWIIGAHAILPIFKSPHQKAIRAYLDVVQTNFFSALRHHFEKKYPEQRLLHTFGTICRNWRGEERMIVGVTPQDNHKPTYDYISADGKVGYCNEASMQSWMERNT